MYFRQHLCCVGVYVEEGPDRDALTKALMRENYIPVYLDPRTVSSWSHFIIASDTARHFLSVTFHLCWHMLLRTRSSGCFIVACLFLPHQTCLQKDDMLLCAPACNCRQSSASPLLFSLQKSRSWNKHTKQAAVHALTLHMILLQSIMLISSCDSLTSKQLCLVVLC